MMILDDTEKRRLPVQTWNMLPACCRRTQDGVRKAKINGEWVEVELHQAGKADANYSRLLG
mgnify:CR=1 FL=1